VDAARCWIWSITDKEKYRIDPNRELLELGAANLAAAFFSGYPVTGGFSRTAVNRRAGARTGLAGLIAALIISTILLWFTHLVHYPVHCFSAKPPAVA